MALASKLVNKRVFYSQMKVGHLKKNVYQKFLLFLEVFFFFSNVAQNQETSICHTKTHYNLF